MLSEDELALAIGISGGGMPFAGGLAPVRGRPYNPTQAARYSPSTFRVNAARQNGWCRNSFVAGTLVLMADGTTKPIEELQLGELVVATDPTTGASSPSGVVATILGSGPKELVDITLDLGDGMGATVTATDNHPFWNHGDQQWQPADTLHVGDVLLAADGTTVTITGIGRRSVRLAAVYNLTIADIHTYHVLAGDMPILVHNDGYTPAPKDLPGFPDAERVRPRTPVQGGGGLRPRWEDGKYIYEWDSRHGEVEKYDRRGRHLGSFDPNTGDALKGPVPGRTCSR